VGVAEAVALLAGGLTGLDGLLLSPLRPAGPVVGVVLLALAGWVVLCAGGGVLLLDRSGRRVYTAVATAEVALVGALLALALLTPLLDTLPVALPLPALALLALGLPVGKLLLAGAPSVLAWVALGPRARARRPEPAAVGPRTRAVTLALIGASLVAVALTTPVPGAATETPATAGTSQH
ncbi:MAG: hypothetical protein M3Q47_15890, partial [Actinomycetota bacterium]|nr:hypothetical protein [Actinomycetota bacterium]